MNRSLPFATIMFLICSGCSGSSDLSGSTGASESVGASATNGRSSHFDLVGARLEQDAAMGRWKANPVDDYQLLISYLNANSPTLVVTVLGGEYVSDVLEPGADGQVYPIEDFGEFPTTVESLLVQTEGIVRAAESAPPNSSGSCDGHFFVINYDEIGVPTFWDLGGPCDDSVGLQVELVELD